MHKLVKSENINMSDSIVVIKENLTSDLMEKRRLGEAPLDPDEEKDVLSTEDKFITKEKATEITAIVKGRAQRDAEEIIASAERNAKNIVGEACAEAEKTKLQAQRNLNDQIEKIKEQEREKAKSEARSEVLTEIANLTESMNDCLEELRKNQKSFFLQVEEMLPQLSLEIAGKILFKKVTCHPEEMDMLIKNAVSGIKGAAWIDLKLGQGLKNIADDLTSTMAQSLKEKGTVLDVSTEGEKNWQVICESDKGIIDASINTQIKNFMDFIDTYTQKE